MKTIFAILARARGAVLACAGLALAATVCAQHRSIQISREPFVEPKASPFAPAAASAAVVTAPRLDHAWEVRTADMRIDRTLERWAQAAGWRVQWDATRHVEIGAPTTFRGSFEAAVRAVLATPGIRLSEFPLEGCLYPNNPPLLRITRQGEQAVECPTEYAE